MPSYSQVFKKAVLQPEQTKLTETRLSAANYVPNKPKKVELRFREHQIGIKTIERVCNYYTNKLPLADILAHINGPRKSADTLSLPDLYTILNHAAQAKKIKQRKKFMEFELEINQFVTVFRMWRGGAKPKEIAAFLPKKEIAITRVLAALNRRHREAVAKFEVKAEGSAREILAKSHPILVAGRKAFIIYLDEIPPGIIEEGVEFPEIEDDALTDLLMEIKEPSGVPSGSIPDEVSNEADKLQEHDQELVSTGNIEYENPDNRDLVASIPLHEAGPVEMPPAYVSPHLRHQTNASINFQGRKIAPPIQGASEKVLEEYKQLESHQSEEELLEADVYKEPESEDQKQDAEQPPNIMELLD